MTVSSVCPLDAAKLRRKGRNPNDLDTVIEWLTGFDTNCALITGVICGVRIEQIEDPIMQIIRYPDTLVDAIANGKSLEKV